MNWFAEPLDNQCNVVLLAYGVHCMLNGARPTKPPAAPSAPSRNEIDRALKDFEPGGAKHERWINGETRLYTERIALYSRKFAGKLRIE